MKLGSDRLAAAATLTVLTVLAPLVLPAPPLFADDPRACPAIDPPVPSSAPPSPLLRPSGFKVFRDPLTGQLRQPTPEEAAELARIEAEAAREESEPVFVVVEHPDGMKSVDLQGSLMQSVVVTRNADGSLSFRCASAGRAAPSPAPAPRAGPAHEEK